MDAKDLIELAECMRASNHSPAPSMRLAEYYVASAIYAVIEGLEALAAKR